MRGADEHATDRPPREERTVRVKKVPAHIDGRGTNATAMELTYDGHTIVTAEESA